MMRNYGGTVTVTGQLFPDQPGFEGMSEDEKKLRFIFDTRRKQATPDDRRAFLKRVKKRRAKKGYR